MQDFLERLQDDRVLILDGALGTELTRRGFSLDPTLWSASAIHSNPQLVNAIHKEYVIAGAELLTANTFRTHRRNLEAAGLGDEAEDWTRKAVQLARAATIAADHPVWVAGSLAPLEDCYTPQNVPDNPTLSREHEEMAHNLSKAGVDLILVETQNTIREAVAATQAAAETGLPVLVSFVCRSDGRLLSGETLTQAAKAVLPFQPEGILVNCLPVLVVPQALAELKQIVKDLPIGAYANTGCFDANAGWLATSMEQPENYARETLRWRDAKAKFIGGCCGTTPDHIRQTRNTLFPAA